MYCRVCSSVAIEVSSLFGSKSVGPVPAAEADLVLTVGPADSVAVKEPESTAAAEVDLSFDESVTNADF